MHDSIKTDVLSSAQVSLPSLTSPLKSHHCTTFLQYLGKYAFVRLATRFNKWSKENVKTRTTRSRTREDKVLEIQILYIWNWDTSKGRSYPIVAINLTL
ncbi:hypothetical protein T05_7580 [Trichinella murrelli]|uniref:Uncharacterized protein n=1 Tax=Trichinella murrelli TaxID=144512 RepID=A0A0V0TZR3_9BILA|nr:hypothetical protein T05_7580 [Trichinella murrelli]